MAANPSPEVKAILKFTPDLTTALSIEPLRVANELLSKELISSDVYSKVMMPTYYSATDHEKAAIMIESVRNVVEITPSKFTEFLDILSKLTWAREIAESLRSTYQSESAPQILQGSHPFSMPSNLVTFTRMTPPSSSMNTVSLASSMTGPSPSQMMQYQERSLAQYGIGIQHTRMGQVRGSHPMAAAATGMQGTQSTPRSMIGVSQPSVEVPHSWMDGMWPPSMYSPPQAQYMGYNTTEMHLHQASAHIGPSAIHAGQPRITSLVYSHMIPHMTPPHPPSSMTGPPPSQMMQYQERSQAHHGIGMQHTRVESSTPEYMTLLTNHDKLVSRLSCDPGDYAIRLQDVGLISSHDHSKMKIASLTPTDKAIVLMSAVREQVERNPDMIHDFLQILLEDESNRDIVKVIKQTLGSTGDRVSLQRESTLSVEPQLSKNDLTKIMSLLKEQSSKWKEIGAGLGFLSEELDSISERPSLFSTSPDSFLEELLTQWLDWPTRYHPDPPTRGVLLQALKKADVGDLAEKMEVVGTCDTPASNPSPEVKAIRMQSHDLITALSNDSLGVAGILLSKELICREVYSKMLIDSYTPSKKAAILVEAVGNTIEIAPVKFQCFLEILSDQVWAKKVVEKLRTTYQNMDGATSVTLKAKDIINLMRLLQSYSYKWNLIGLSLGFTQHELNAISGMLKLLQGAPVSYLQELLSQWVQWPTTDHPNHPTVRALCTALRSSLVGLGGLADEVEKEMEMKQFATGTLGQEGSTEQKNDIATRIETLEDRFDDLRARLTEELETCPIQVQVLLDVLTLLPMSLKKEYESLIVRLFPALRKETTTNGVMVHLSPLMSFLDYGLLECLIRKFGSAALKKDMRSYCSNMVIFKKQTTIRELIDYLPGQTEIPPKFALIEAKIGEDASKCTLEQIDTIRRRYCSEVRLSEIVFHLIAVVESN